MSSTNFTAVVGRTIIEWDFIVEAVAFAASFAKGVWFVPTILF